MEMSTTRYTPPKFLPICVMHNHTADTGTIPRESLDALITTKPKPGTVEPLTPLPTFDPYPSSTHTPKMLPNE